MMRRFTTRFFLLIFPSFFAASAGAQTSAARVEETAVRSTEKTPAIAPVPQHLFGAIALSTRSEEARGALELAIDKYENAMYDDAVVHARHATEKDPRSALGYAMLSFAARRTLPDSSALAKAKSLLSQSASDEQLLVRWMTSIQERDLLPAIMSMNDLLKRYPRNKHILYLTGEWLFLQQDENRARTLMETALEIDPNFPAALNRLGYLYVQIGEPLKAVASLKRYMELQSTSANPEDSLGEILRLSGDDRGSLEHYGAALQVDPTYFPSQLGLGDTLTLMGDFGNARQEYDRAIQIADNPRDELYAKYQKALVYFWEGQPVQGCKSLYDLSEEAASKKEPNERFDIELGRAMLAPNVQNEIDQLGLLSVFLAQPLAGMSEADRGVARATVLRERARVAALNRFTENAVEAISELEGLATSSRDLVIENAYESARGYLLFAQDDLTSAKDELAADPQSPLALQQLAITQEKLGLASAAQATRTRLKYRRGPTVEWFLVTHMDSSSLHQKFQDK
jgi:tetratricopeptide (TPR) repeat protein